MNNEQLAALLAQYNDLPVRVEYHDGIGVFSLPLGSIEASTDPETGEPVIALVADQEPIGLAD